MWARMQEKRQTWMSDLNTQVSPGTLPTQKPFDVTFDKQCTVKPALSGLTSLEINASKNNVNLKLRRGGVGLGVT